VLDALRNQSLSKDRWELLLVDNASEAPLASEWELTWHPNARHVFETELGLASARRRGIYEARSDLLVFVDDDNILDPDYLSEALRIKVEWPMLGVWGSGAIIPEFESHPPDRLKRLLPHLALREYDRVYWGNVPHCIESMPWGAGMCVRRSVAAEYDRLDRESSVRISDRRGKSLMSGGDTEICWVACNVGLGTGTFPQLRVTHLIPKERTVEKYLLNLMEAKVITTILLDFKWMGQVPETRISLRKALSILKAAVLSHGLDRQLFFVNLRGMIKAKRIIDANCRNGSAAEDQRRA
jgi:glycosyltransferase involved in cell wall biosynthesis